MLTKEDLAKYPFLKKASEYIESLNLSINDFTDKYNDIVERALERIKFAVEGKLIKIDLYDPEKEILSYAVALALIYGLKNAWLIRRFANNEQKLYYEMLTMEDDHKIIEIAKEADLLIHEATFASDLSDRAHEEKHSTAEDAAKIAKLANVKKLILTHISSRYKDTKILEEEAKKIFENAEIAEDFKTYDLKI